MPNADHASAPLLGWKYSEAFTLRMLSDSHGEPRNYVLDVAHPQDKIWCKAAIAIRTRTN